MRGWVAWVVSYTAKRCKMKKLLILSSVAALGLGLAACDSAQENAVENQADAVEETADAQADAIREAAEGTATEAAAEATADAVEATGEAKADALEDKADKMDAAPN
jgi:regulator of protease activity HflC (stomatin/prohibitin superfamily)